ncbi:MAG: DUF4136 domain-containing protein [Flavobacteriales bacterium CG_4_9_14_3_um_filter_40_17]|nr:MAG: DUF4136 domain-containing protein [Flavobacteriales bacterium CG_4_9_14_3_um_filter_40_17]
MKTVYFSIVLFVVFLTACSSVQVATDYDKKISFDQYKTFAFYKDGIDKVEISDLDKKRILRAIESQMLAKGFTKSENPDLMVNIFAKAKERVDVYNPYGYGYGYYGYPYFYGPYGYGGGYGNNVSVSTEGVLFVDLIDAKKKELIWQGKGTGVLSDNIDRKEKNINEFVSKILEQYPPGNKK